MAMLVYQIHFVANDSRCPEWLSASHCCGFFLHNWSMGSKVTRGVRTTLNLWLKAEMHAEHVVVEACNKPWHSKHPKAHSQRPDAIFFQLYIRG